jgi:hypothetical protein
MDEVEKKKDTVPEEKDIEVESVVKDVEPPAPKDDDDDDLLDVRVHNPLKKITGLLEDIKKQKAFSFTLRGSFGIMGVALALSLIGVFGTNYALCDKGTQTRIGTLRALAVIEEEEDSLWNRIQNINKYVTALITGKKIEDRIEKRTILVESGNHTIQLLKGTNVSLVPFRERQVIVTGSYNNCSEKLKIHTQSEIEEFPQNL